MVGQPGALRIGQAQKDPHKLSDSFAVDADTRLIKEMKRCI